MFTYLFGKVGVEEYRDGLGSRSERTLGLALHTFAGFCMDVLVLCVFTAIRLVVAA